MASSVSTATWLRRSLHASFSGKSSIVWRSLILIQVRCSAPSSSLTECGSSKPRYFLQYERPVALAGLGVDGGQVVGGREQRLVVLRDLQRLFLPPAGRVEDGGEDAVVRVLGVEVERLLHVGRGLLRVAFGVPVHGQVA